MVTTNSGYPLDQNLYQAVKGMSAGATVVRPGGTIICAAECRDGFPDHGSYREVLASEASPEALLATIAARERTVPDQWQVQVQAKVQAPARGGGAHVVPLRRRTWPRPTSATPSDVAATVHEALGRSGPDARVCVLPEGPQTIPYVR